MRNENLEPVAWVQKLSSTLTFSLDGERNRGYSEEKLRTILVAKIRWLVLVVFGVYSFYAASFFYFSSYGIFFTPLQLTCLFLSAASVFIYNSILYFRYDTICRFPLIDHVQIILDLLFVTILIHFSGGGASWFWPVYLIVTIEASFLLNSRKSVWTIGTLGGVIYGALLLAEFAEVFPSVKMPFVDKEIHHDLLYLILIWLWVTLLNATMAMISSFFMSIIRQDNKALRESEESLLNFLESAHDLIQCTSETGEILYVNRSWQQTLGYQKEDVARLTLKDVISRESRHRFLGDIKKVASGEPVPPFETNFVGKDGRTVIVEGTINCSHNGENSNQIWSICRDITEKKQTQEQLYHLAHHDILTGLPNRILFFDRLGQAKALAHRLKLHVGVLFLDLDRFKVINDTLGHPLGDKVLQAAAKRLTHCVREIDTIARIGGDEFVIILVNVENRSVVEGIGQKILDVFSQPFLVEEHELFVTTSIGVCMYPDDGEDPVELIKNADIAMYHAKSQGRNNFKYYDGSMDENADKKLAVINSLRKGLDREEFCLHYQPKIEMTTGKITALEALLRWHHPELGMVMPNDFIPIAEETGLIVPLGEWVLREACSQNKKWQDMGLQKLRVAVNLSGYQLQQKNLVDTVTRILAETEMDPQLLELEITESVVMQDPDFAVLVLSELRDVGIHISIDDFGTGYSSLAHLKRFSINTLKIDRSFVRDVEINTTDAAIATAIIAMGNSLNLNVIAEGVETEGQFDFLKDKACDEMQGFLYSGPIPAADVPALLNNAQVNRSEKEKVSMS